MSGKPGITITGDVGILSSGDNNSGPMNFTNVSHHPAGPAAASDGGEKTALRPSDKNYFNRENTVVLSVAGYYKSENELRIFQNDVEAIKKMFMQYGIHRNNIYEVLPRGQQRETIAHFLKVIGDELKKMKDGRFIFYYAGHSHKDNSFWLYNGDNKVGDDYLDRDLKDAFQSLVAEKRLYILDTCYSGGADMGARTLDQGEDKGNPTVPVMPCLVDDDESTTRGDQQFLQWCACLPEEKAKNAESNGVFTGAILKAMKNVPSGSTVSVRNLHQEVKASINDQTTMLKPDTAINDSINYFSTFPEFAKID